MRAIKRDFSVAVKAVIIRGDSILVLKRSKEEMAGSYMNSHEIWDLPGGGIRYFEKAEDGLHREIWEETGLKVRIIKPLSLFDAIKPHIHLCIFTYVCQYESGEVRLSEEHDAFFWMTLEKAQTQGLPKWMIRDFQNGMKEYQEYLSQ